MLDNLKKYRIILASESPRRQQLLQELGLDFEVRPSHAPEAFPAELGMTAIPVFLAEQKANALSATMQPDELLITADTIVWKDGRIMNKPASRQEAIDMLKDLSNAQHQVITGMHIRTTERQLSFHSVSEVRFEELLDAEIAYYVDHFHPYDKAGGYGIQEWLGYVAISRIEGSFYNVMGLPLHQLYQHLKKF
ncbi:MAG: Maf family nucleotide pyrophosphatase [Bacteroidales bacterium]|jgi:septum formation protein|nr:Maf family nucleotide pyrophosphatase [Bacteroidales bacterium]